MQNLASPTGAKAHVARRVRDELRDEIRRGRFDRGVLPSEEALIVEKRASRNAVRMALSLLRSEGLVRRLQGLGTFVVEDSQAFVPLDPPSTIQRTFVNGSTRVRYQPLAVLRLAASPGIASRLETSVRDEVVFIERLTYLDDRPLSLGTAWIPASLGGPIVTGCVDLRQGITDVLVRGLGLEPGRSDYCVEATSADEAVASLLEVSIGSPLLLLETVTRLPDGRPACLGYQRGRADRMRYIGSGSLRATA